MNKRIIATLFTVTLSLTQVNAAHAGNGTKQVPPRMQNIEESRVPIISSFITWFGFSF